MDDLLSAFGLEEYLQQLAWLLRSSPDQAATLEGIAIGGPGVVAVILLFLSVVRRSAVGAVSFSFLALISLVNALMLGRLDFLNSGTQALIVCLFAATILLFMTATVRVARDNPLMGGVVMISLLALLGIGGVSVLNIVSGWPFAAIGMAVAMGLLVISLLIEILRFDRSTLMVAPGLLVALGSVPAMTVMGERGGEGGLFMGALPLLMLAGGAVFAAISAQFVVTSVSRDQNARHRKARSAPFVAPTAVSASAAPANRAMLREVDMEEDAQSRPVREDEPILEADVLTEISAQDDDEHVEEPAVAAEAPEPEPEPELQWQDEEPPAQERRPAFAYGRPAEPVSAQWGRGGSARRDIGASLADNEYVWDMMATREVRMGPDFADMLDVPYGRTASPDLLRDLVDDQSLDAFDEAILGGGQPRSGRFDVDLLLLSGRGVRLQGRRHVDHDGLLSRLEATASSEAMAAAAPAPAPVPAPQAEPEKEEAPSHPVLSRSAPKAEGAATPLEALEKGEIVAWFQPIVRLSDRVTVGYEALARWEQPDGTVKVAADFVPELIDDGHGLALAEVIIASAAEELAGWIERMPNKGQFITVNIAASDLHKEEVASLVQSAVRKHKLPDGALVLELTEDRIKSSMKDALQSAKAIRKAGASLAIDDFGVGYSTLSRLTKFNFDLVKTDKSLSADLDTNRKARAAFKAVIAAAHKSKSPVIAEGCESEEVAQTLEELGCDFAQGYLFGGVSSLSGDGESDVSETAATAAPDEATEQAVLTDEAPASSDARTSASGEEERSAPQEDFAAPRRRDRRRAAEMADLR